jgi:hypothetical protein
MMKAYALAKIYARQRGIKEMGIIGWGYNPTPRQAKRLQRVYAKELAEMVKGLRP